MAALSRRQIVASGGIGLLGAAQLAAPASGASGGSAPAKASTIVEAAAFGLVAGSAEDQSGRLQSAIDQAAKAGAVLVLPAGVFHVGGLSVSSAITVRGAPGGTILKRLRGGDAPIMTLGGGGIRLEDLHFDGAEAAVDGALLDAEGCERLALVRLDVSQSGGGGIRLVRCSGSVEDCNLNQIADTAILALDSTGLVITRNVVTDVGNNAIQVWRSAPGEDGTQVALNRIERVKAEGGGSGENGNGINVFRADAVSVSGNRITDCAYSAVRVNAGSDVQILGNSCLRSGEVAIYAEFGFQGAIISNNLVDTAALGISITNFNHGGRLAVCSGNLIRNLFTRSEGEERGIGIAVEADATVTGNVIEKAPIAGIMVGWGPFQRDVVVTGNLVRETRVGIAASVGPGAAKVLVGQNMLSACSSAAIIGHQNGKAVTKDLVTAGPDEIPINIVVSGNVG